MYNILHIFNWPTDYREKLELVLRKNGLKKSARYNNNYVYYIDASRNIILSIIKKYVVNDCRDNCAYGFEIENMGAGYIINGNLLRDDTTTKHAYTISMQNFNPHIKELIIKFLKWYTARDVEVSSDFLVATAVNRGTVLKAVAKAFNTYRIETNDYFHNWLILIGGTPYLAQDDDYYLHAV